MASATPPTARGKKEEKRAAIVTEGGEPFSASVEDAPAASLSLSVVMPVYNEEKTLVEVLERVRAVPVVTQVVIVDDRSTDGTSAILEALAQATDPARLRVLRHETNQGKGASILTGLRYATGDVVVIQDADLEYEPEQFADLLRVMTAENATVVYGSRFRGSVEGMRLPNRIANKILTFLANALFGAGITDEAS